MTWKLINIFLILLFFEFVCINIANSSADSSGVEKPLTKKKICDLLQADAAASPTVQQQEITNPCNLNSQQNSDNIEIANLMQNDESINKNVHQSYTNGILRRKQSSAFSSTPTQHNYDQFNRKYTSELILKQGRVKGLVRTMHLQTGLRNVDQYLGIPYAAAPVGNGRFMPPGAPPPWHGVKVAISLSPVCPQNLPSLNHTKHHISSGRYDQLKRLIPYLKEENEDCLFLNLYVPKYENIGPHPKYPIIIYIHGESYEWNSGNSYDGSVLASYGQVIVITLNYRLGILGFFKPGTSDHTVSNFGLLDQIAALQWIKDNIGAFGGDNKAVTLMGHGTGAACVNLLMVSPVARGLFHRAILMSGSALSDWAIANHPLQSTMQVLQELNCPLRDDSEQILACLHKKRYSEILKSSLSTPNFSTKFGPVVDNLVVPNQPQKVMSQYNGVFSRYDMLFGLTEIESYHNLNAVGLMHGLLQAERDSYLKLYLENRFEIRPDIAFALTLQEYIDIYNNPERPLAEEHRDTVLEILSDARVAAPMIQTGIYHSKVNPRSYMYVFAHNSKAGEFANHPQSIVGEDLPYIFGAPLASAGPFQSRYSPEERLLSEAVMLYWTNFAKTGNPKAPWRDHFLNLEPKDWERYDIDWPEFNGNNLNYLNIGIPPVVNQKYKQKFMHFWNEGLNEKLDQSINDYKTISNNKYLDLNTPQLSLSSGGSNNQYHQSGGGGGAGNLDVGGEAHINYFPDKSTENPYRTLKNLLNLNYSDMYNTQQSTQLTTFASSDSAAASSSNNNNVVENVQLPSSDNEIIVKADASLNILIGIVILFVLINVIIFLAYVIKRNYYNKTLKRKLDILTIDGTTDDDVKRSKFNDGDESFILDIVRRKNEYEPVQRNRSPINGFLLSRQLSLSTVDGHTKVCDWMAREINKGSPKVSKKKSPSFSFKNGFFRRSEKKNVGVDASTNIRTTAIMAQESAELVDPKFYDIEPKDVIICEDVDIDGIYLNTEDLGAKEGAARRNSISSLKGSADILKIDHRPSKSEPVPMYYRKQVPDDDISIFVEDVDINVTSRDDTVERELLSPEDALKTIRMRNYPKVLPKYPEDYSDYVSASIKRRSLPPQYLSMNSTFKPGPVPPLRTTSTLGRRPSVRRDSTSITTSPFMMAEEPPVEEDPEITCNILHVGPLIPCSNESIHSTLKKPPITPTSNKTFSFENSVVLEHTNNCSAQQKILDSPTYVPATDYNKPPSGSDKHIGPKIIIKPTISRQNSSDNKKITRVQAPQDSSTIQTPTATVASKIPTRISTHDRSRSTSDSSSKASSSSMETVKQIF